jgi:hypothetical protein
VQKPRRPHGDSPLRDGTKERLRAAGIHTKEQLLEYTPRELQRHMLNGDLHVLIVWLRERDPALPR